MHLIIVSVILIAFQMNTSIAVTQNRKDLSTCTQEKAVSVQILPGFGGQCKCLCQDHPAKSVKRDDYTHTKGVGSHKLHTMGKNWNDARKICIAEGGYLAIINSKAEAQALHRLFKKQYQEVRNAETDLIAWLGLHDQFEEGDWITVLGDSLSSTGYEEWNRKMCNDMGPQPDNWAGNQNCGALFRVCGTMDDANCISKLPFFCEMPDFSTN